MNPPLEDIHLSPHDLGGWTDPIGNDTILPNPLFLQTAGYLMVGKFPLPLLSTFLHEATHHWCFESRLGYAVSALWLRARRRALILSQTKDADTDQRYDFLDDMIRYWSIVLMLRPLAEGMALFAEHDLYSNPRHPNELLPPLYAWLMATAGDYDEKKGMAAAEKTLLERLLGTRCSVRGIERKRSIFAQSLRTDGGGYLAGYLAVKAMWGILFTKSPQVFEKKGLFLCFLRDWIFDSTELLTEFFNEDLHDINIPDAISRAFQTRLGHLVNVTDGQLSEFEQRNLRPPQYFSSDPPKADYPTSVEKLFRAAESVDQTRFAWLDTQTINRRHLMRVFSAKARVRVNEHGRVLVFPIDSPSPVPPDFPIMSMPAVEGSTQGEGEGIVEYHISITKRFQAVLIFREGKIVSTSAEEKHAEELKEYEIGGGVEHLRELRNLSSEIIESVIDRAGVREELDASLVGIRDITDRIYQRRGLLVSSDAEEGIAAEILAKHGFWSLLDERTELVSALSLCSAATSAFRPVSVLTQLFEDLGCVYPDHVNDTETRFADYGLQYFLGPDKLRICIA